MFLGLDLFSGAGGMGMGLKREGFTMVGCDIAPQPRYPGEFHQADALETLDRLLIGKSWHGYYLDNFSIIHASPVCKGYTELNSSGKDAWPLLIPEVRKRLQQTGLTWTIENVEGAIDDLPASLMLCGSMFGLRVQRHRFFESNVLLFAPGHCNHEIPPVGVYGWTVWDSSLPGKPRPGRHGGVDIRPAVVPFEAGCKAMGIDWMIPEELSQAVPPAYAEWIGWQLMNAVQKAA